MVMRREGIVSGCCGVVCVPRREFRTVEVAWSGIAFFLLDNVSNV